MNIIATLSLHSADIARNACGLMEKQFPMKRRTTIMKMRRQVRRARHSATLHFVLTR